MRFATTLVHPEQDMPEYAKPPSVPFLRCCLVSSLENRFRNVHCLGIKQAGGRLPTRIVQRQRRTFICSLGHAPPGKLIGLDPALQARLSGSSLFPNNESRFQRWVACVPIS